MTQSANFKYLRAVKQRGLVLFLALVTLVVLSLAAVALIRSVDTNTLIVGNIAFKQSTINAADVGIESAIAWLAGVQSANSNINVLTNPTHPLNRTNIRLGYYANADSINLLTDSNWNVITTPAIAAGTGTTVRYIIERMCRTANVAIKTADCLYTDPINNNSQKVPLPSSICNGPGCPIAGQSPQYRITAKATGPNNSVSYVQAFVH